jgi:LmbE family N-acetylglucosaminyl deacetylase
MQKVLCVFAHPDDEAFGPGGTIALWAKQGKQINLLCITKGEAGMNNSDGDICDIRTKELKSSAKILGIEKIEHLDYLDGEIGNKAMIEIEKHIINKINAYQPDTLLTFNLDGVSGHLDHIAVASATTQAFKKTTHPKNLYYFSNTKIVSEELKNYFVYAPPGFTPDQVDEVIDVSSVWEAKVKAMYCHQSQIEDVKWILPLEERAGKKELFLIRKKA